ncbi:MAG: formyltetrahydrofolate deformylase [Flavobacteriaceae bacterium]|nr:formyltetrahydrofolate deformylase [Flavobacteriaceae bacterium]|tara:strand:- start:374 stop:1228 length:855 start_codon:yes stop_codon:yes gene_type:complete
MNQITILMYCADQKGIIAGVTNFIHQKQGNITYIDQYVDRPNATFFMRVECDFVSPNFNFDDFKISFNLELGSHFSLHCDFYLKGQKPKMAVFVSKYDHCLYDILAKHHSGELEAEIPFIISNHPDLEIIAKRFEIPFYHIVVHKENKAQAELEQLAIMKKHKVDFIVLARYMQIVSAKLIEHYTHKIINIHHSFLPAFPGAKPYHSAFERGVKIIGATSHYVTEELDAGPIIEQDITRVTHLNSIADFIEKGRDLERIVLLRALKLHCNRKVMVYGNKTVVFS